MLKSPNYTRFDIEELEQEANNRLEEIFTSLGIDASVYGVDIRMPCPIHGGDNSTGFSYRADLNIWQCFTGQCHEEFRPNIFGLVQGVFRKNEQTITYGAAIAYVAKVLGYDLEATDINPEEYAISKEINSTKRKMSILEKIQKMHETTKFNPIRAADIIDKHVNSQYFAKEFKQETLKKFMVGDCNDPTKPMYMRSYCPILDDNGEYIIGVSGRTWHKECPKCFGFHRQGAGCPEDNHKIRSVPKWLHYGFQRSNTLYNYWNAKSEIVKTGVAVLTEGPKDVWKLDEAGIKTGMAAMGLSFSLNHIKKLISAGCQTVLLVMDNDEGGLDGAKKAKESLSMYFNVIDITDKLPDGKDIGDLTPEEIDNIVVKKYLELTSAE